MLPDCSGQLVRQVPECQPGPVDRLRLGFLVYPADLQPLAVPLAPLHPSRLRHRQVPEVLAHPEVPVLLRCRLALEESGNLE